MGDVLLVAAQAFLPLLLVVIVVPDVRKFKSAPKPERADARPSPHVTKAA
jgi:hypothetical protein